MKIHLAQPADFSFLECVNAHGWKNLLPFSWDAENGVLTRVERFVDHEPMLLTIRSDDDGIVIETDDDVPNQAVIDKVSHVLQLDISMQTFHSYCASNEALKHIPLSKHGRLLRSPDIFEDVVKVIATTNTTWAQTKAMVSRIVSGFGSPLPSDPARRAFPTPAQIASVSAAEFAETARMGYRSASVHQIARDIVEGRLDLERWNDSANLSEDLYKRLLSLPGIGPYAASCLLIYLGRYDRVNVDSWARALVGKELGRKVTDKEVHDFFQPYGQWKALVYHFYRWREP